MTKDLYILSRPPYRERGLLSVLDEAKIPYSNVSEFGRRALTLALTKQQIVDIKHVDEYALVDPYEGLKVTGTPCLPRH